MGLNEPIDLRCRSSRRWTPPAGEPKPRDVLIMPYLSSKELGAKLTAIGFFYRGQESRHGHGTISGGKQHTRAEVREGRRLRVDVRRPEARAPTRDKESKTITDRRRVREVLRRWCPRPTNKESDVFRSAIELSADPNKKSGRVLPMPRRALGNVRADGARARVQRRLPHQRGDEAVRAAAELRARCGQELGPIADGDTIPRP